MKSVKNLFFIFFFIPAFSQGQVTESKLQRVQNYIDSLRNANGFPGMSVAVIYPGGIQSFVTGYSKLERQTPLTKNDLMFSGSTGKMFFSVLAMRLVKEGRLNLDERIEKYIGGKSWFHRIPNAKELTVRHLLNHSTGIEEYYPLGDFLEQLKNNPDREWRIQELIGYALDRKPLFEAGKSFGYADTNYLILGVILSELLKKDPFDVVGNTIFKQQALRNTVPSTSRKMKVATGYISGRVFPWKGANYDSAGLLVYNPKFEMMGGGFASTPSDMAMFVHALMKGKVVDTSMLSLMKNGIPANTGRNHQYGLGLQIRPYANGVGYGHSGWFPGYITDVEYYPAEDITISVQFNTDDFTKLKGGSRNYMMNILNLLTAKQ